MSIQELFPKFKSIFHNTEYQLSALIIGVALGSFILGRASEKPLTPIETLRTPSVMSVQNEAVAVTSSSNNHEPASTTSVVQPLAGTYVASKNSTKYHLPWCVGAKQIKEENKIWFATKEEAEKAGYTPAANCKGI